MKSSEMSLYDKDIRRMQDILSKFEVKSLQSAQPWNTTEQESLVLRSDMAYELGGEGKAAVSALAFTANPELITESGVCLVGKDLSDLSRDTSYARITLLLLEETGDYDPQQWYGIFRKIDYTRYHVYPKGYMMRISAVKEREPVRVSRDGLAAGMSFAGIGRCFADAYLKHNQVKAVQTIFVTDPAAPYGQLQEVAHRFEQITESMNKVFQGLNMDCSTCGQRELCDEIEGLKSLHRDRGTGPLSQFS